MTTTTVPVTPTDVFARIAARLKAQPGLAKTINTTYQFDITKDASGDGGTWLVDLTLPPGSEHVTQGAAPAEKPAKLTVSMATTDFVALCMGKLDGQIAFMMGKVKFKGDIALALKLPQFIR